jgi:hypothetical protein
VSLGAITPFFSGGIGGEVMFVPLPRKVSPLVSVSAGHVFDSDLHGVPLAFGVKIDGQQVGYDYASLEGGVAYSPIPRVSLTLQMGVNFTNLTAVPDDAKPSFKNATLHIWTVPSGRLAVTVFL